MPVSEADEQTRSEGAPVDVSGSRHVGLLAGRYEVLALLGAGGMGSVYLANDLELGERVAVKLLRGEYSLDTEFIERLRSEVRLARRVTHKNVARTYDIGDHEGERFLTMEYVDGESLSARIRRDGVLPLLTFFRLAGDVAEGLVAAHAAGVVHRDLKPDNILVSRDGRARITDFGAAASRDGKHADLVIGTPSYMAPEQFEGRFDERSDVFALGVVLHVMLTGAKPFKAELRDRPARAPNPNHQRPGIPVPLGALVEKCLAPAPADRYPTASTVLSALAGIESTILAAAPAPDTIASSPTGPAELALRGVAPAPRSILLRGVGGAQDSLLARGLRREIEDHINTRSLLYASSAAEREHEARVDVDVRVEGQAIVVDVRVFGGDDFEFWRGSFKSDNGRALGVVEDAAVAIERALAVSVPRGAVVQSLTSEAVVLYLGGRQAQAEYWPPALQRAATAFEEALALCPAHPLLLSALATTRARQCFFSGGFLDEARATSELAVRLAPDLAEAHVARAAVSAQDAEPEEAVVALLRAVLLAPGHVDALAAMGRLSLDVGAPTVAIRLGEAAHSRDRSDLHLVTVARAHALLGRHDAARATLDRVRGVVKDTLAAAFRMRLGMWVRDEPSVRAVLEDFRAHAKGDPKGGHRLAYMVAEAVLDGRCPRISESYMAEELASATSRARRALAFQVCAESAAYVGDYETTLASIEAAIAEGLFDAFWLERCPVFDDLRGAARFEAARDIVAGRARPVLALIQGWHA